MGINRDRARTAEPHAADDAFHGLYRAHGRAVLAYAVRRSADAQDAADVVAETFLVAWRRIADVPTGPEARLWLYGVARRVLANQHRAERRRERLAERLGRELAARAAAVPGTPAPTDGNLMFALSALPPDDREILLLAAWEQLEPAEIAEVLGISRVAARSRLHRARAKLRAGLADSERQATTTPAIQEAR